MKTIALYVSYKLSQLYLNGMNLRMNDRIRMNKELNELNYQVLDDR